MNTQKSKTAFYLLTVLRVGIGWHLLYEGLTKMLDPSWTAAGYLESATGPLAGMFNSMAASEATIQIVNTLNIAALTLIGLGLMLGFLTRWSQGAAILLLFLYYISHPPVFTEPGFFREGAYFIISKDLIEILSLIVLMVFPTGKFLGLDGLLSRYFKKSGHKLDNGQPEPEAKQPEPQKKLERREVVKYLATLPFFGAVVYGALRKSKMESPEEQQLVDAASGPTKRYVQQVQSGSDQLSLKNLKGKKFTEETSKIKGTLPEGMLGSLQSKRVILGGNLLSGYVHSRDLIYVSRLVRHYHQKDRIFRTLMLAEQSGVNTLLSNPVVMPLMTEYWKEGYGNIQFISDCAGLEYDEHGAHPMKFQKYLDIVKSAIDNGADAGYIQGETADYYIENGEVDKIVKVMDLVRDNGLPIGIGAHKIGTIKRCVELGLETDFWMKTFHSHDYWSAQHPKWHDNIFCYDPQETEEFMQGLKEPWIAFKTMAAGSIKPEEAFPYCLNRGADFLCVGMYDFQIVEDVNTALNAFNNVKGRKRPWRG
jgi:uncharacterized membrane protein YphA (DoxX/SURF4 family)